MANFFDQFDTVSEKEKESSGNFFDQFDPPAKQEAKKEAPKPVAPVATPTDDKEMFPLLRQTADLPLKTGAGVVTGVRMIADAFGADNSVGQNLRGVENYIADLYSAQSKKDSKEIARIMKEAEDKGVAEQVAAGVKAFSVAPVDMLASALGTTAPAIAAGMAATLAGIPTLAGLAVTGTVGALMGAGTIKGSIYDVTKEVLKERTNLSPKQIEALAVKAQEYGGDNADQIALGAALGTWGASSGVEPAIARQIAKGVATKEATKAAIKATTAKETALAAERGVLKHGAITGGKEFIQEGLEGGQEQAAQNIALQRMGFDVPTMQGVYGQATLEGMAGLGMGKVTGMREAAKAKRELAEDAIQGTNIAGGFTTAKEEAQRAGVGFDKESADLVMPASDATGTPLVGGVIAPDVTSIPPAAETKTKKAKTTGVALDTVEDAANYVQALDAGTQKPNTMQVNKLMNKLGITPPEKGDGYLGRAVAAVRTHLAEQGAPDATRIDTQAGGAGPGVATLADQSQTAAGAIGSESRGMVSTGTDVRPDLDGAKQQPTSLSSIAQIQIKKRLEEGETPYEIISLYDAPNLKNEVGEYIKFLTQGTSNKFPTLTRGSVTPGAVRALTNEQLNIELNNINLSDAEYGLVKTELDQRQQGTTSGTTTSQAQQTAPQGQTASAAGTTVTPKTLADLSPDMQTEVKRRQTEIAKIEAKGKDASEQKSQLNRFLTKLGVTGTLSAKRDIKKDFLDEGELPYAVEGEEKSGIVQAQERVQAYKESLTDEKGKPRTIPDYDISAEDQQLYNEMRKEINPQVKAANEKRNELTTAYEAALKEYNQAEAGPEEDAAFKVLNEAEDALQEHGPAQRELPEYSKKFAADYKDVYFGNISAGPLEDGKRTFGSSKREHQKAAAALQAYLQKTGGSHKEELTVEKRRAVNHYEEGRGDYSKIFGVEFPAWSKLTQDQKDIFLQGMPTLAGAQQTVSFAKLASQINKDDSLLSEGEKREKQNTIDRQEKVRRESEEQQERDRVNREAIDRTKGSGNTLPTHVIKMVMDGNLRGVLEYMRDVKLGTNATPTKRVMKMVAGALSSLNLNTKIEIVEAAQIQGDLAQYDPVKDVIYVTREGLSSTTILHEIVHAGTVKVINEYLYGNKGSLSQLQLNAIRQLERIMNETRGSLAEDYKEAYKNLFEFVSYALTSEQLQQDLHGEADVSRLESRLFGTETTKTNLPENKSQWSKFKLAIAGVLKLRDIYLTKSGKLSRAVQPDFVMEIAAAFDDIISKPTEPIYLPVLPAKKAAAPAKTPKTAEEFRESGLYDADAAYKLSEKENPTNHRSALFRMFTTREGWRNIARKVQDKSYASRSLHNKLAKADKIKRDMSGKFNNFDEQGDLATGEARQFLTDYLQEPLDNVRASFQEWIQLTGQKTEKALEEFHKISEMFHEPERRNAKWVTSVPLSTAQNLTHTGKPISAAERRIAILGDQRTGKAGLIHKVELTKSQKQALWQELTSLATNHADPLGDSPRISEKMRERFAKPGSTHKGIDINKDAPIYNVLGIEQATVDKRMAEYMAKSQEERNAIEKILAGTKVLSDATAELNKIGNYWSTPVSNIVGMYDYQHYMPFKGISKHSITDDLIDPERSGKELQEQEHAADGRFKTSDNPILQLINDAYRSAGRAGRRNYTQAIKNAVDDGSIPGKIVKTIKFEERNTVDMNQFKGGANIFHYNADGSIDIIRISEPKILNALRYSFRDASPMLDFANTVTGFFGAMHTRYNYNFAPLNFVRDTLTNTFNIGASRQLGPLKSLQYLNSISVQIVKNGLGKAMTVALLEEKGDAASKKMLLDAAAKDPFVADMLEYLRFGGKTTYLQGFSLKSNLEQLSKNTIGRSRIITNLEDLTRLIDCWNNMFEFTGRTAAYSLYKEEALKRHIADGLSDKKGPQGQMSSAERAAATEAAAWVKNLANFEKVGELGRGLGSAYMFIRPSATGAVRAVEAVMPAFTSEKSEINDMPPQIANDPVAKDKYIKNFQIERRNAQIMVGALMGVGYSMYMLSMLGAPDDEWKRNNTKTDNMEQWTRSARFHLSNEVSQSLGLGKDVVFQSPWGFGLGSFAAIGAQLGGMIHGNTSVKEGLGNIVGTILPDSFLPLPMSKIPITDSFLHWLVDSIAPTVLRPVVEFISNKNGIGQAINSAAQRRMGDAFTGSDRIPEIYKDVAKWWFRKTQGEGLLGIPGDISPNTIYFFANSYLDGISKLGELTYNWASLDKGEREFNPKNDIPLFGSFFGAKTNVDSREYGKIEEKIKEIDKRLVSMKQDDPVVYAGYVAKHPLHQNIVDVYRSKQGELNALRQKATEFRNMKGLSPKQRDQVLKIITLEQNMLKHQMVMQFNAMGMEP